MSINKLSEVTDLKGFNAFVGELTGKLGTFGSRKFEHKSGSQITDTVTYNQLLDKFCQLTASQGEASPAPGSVKQGTVIKSLQAKNRDGMLALSRGNRAQKVAHGISSFVGQVKFLVVHGGKTREEVLDRVGDLVKAHVSKGKVIARSSTEDSRYTSKINELEEGDYRVVVTPGTEGEGPQYNLRMGTGGVTGYRMTLNESLDKFVFEPEREPGGRAVLTKVASGAAKEGPARPLERVEIPVATLQRGGFEAVVRQLQPVATEEHGEGATVYTSLSGAMQADTDHAIDWTDPTQRRAFRDGDDVPVGSYRVRQSEREAGKWVVVFKVGDNKTVSQHYRVARLSQYYVSQDQESGDVTVEKVLLTGTERLLRMSRADFAEKGMSGLAAEIKKDADAVAQRLRGT